jgi:eukaryotic-like serine/threonine-protein kinase
MRQSSPMSSDSAAQYEIVRKIARGGMGEVYLARQIGIQGFAKDVVLKRIHAELAVDPEFVTMFLQEARIAALLDHPNIVQIIELGRLDGSYFLVMEYVPGLSLSRLLKAADGALPLNIAIQIAAGVAAGLQYAHDRRDGKGEPLNLVHRDVSPPNILVSTSGSVKITDFGIAKVRSSATKTQAGVIKGKFSYISPEQARGRAADRQSDIYSLGLVLYEMTTGHRAYPLAKDSEVLNAVAHGRVRPPDEHVPSFPPDLRAVMMRALAIDRNQRYAQCHELQDELLALLERRGGSTPGKLGQYVQQMVQLAEGGAQDPEAKASPAAAADASAEVLAEELEREGDTIVLARIDELLVEEEDRTLVTRREPPPLVTQREPPPLVIQLPPPLTTESEIPPLPPLPTTPLPPLPTTPLPPLPTTPLPVSTPDVDVDVPARHSLARIVVPTLAIVALVASILLVRALWHHAPSGNVARKAATAPRRDAKVADAPAIVASRRLDARPVDTARLAADATSRPIAKTAVAKATKAMAPPPTPKPVPARPTPRPGPARPTPAPGQVLLSVTSDPVAEVFLGRRRLGRTPLKANVPRRSLTLVLRNSRVGLHVRRTVTPAALRHTAAFVFKRGKIAFRVEAGRIVILDGVLVGTTPLPALPVYEGRHTIVLATPGRTTKQQLQVEVTAGEVASVSR